jgi:hypothetical protein
MASWQCLNLVLEEKKWLAGFTDFPLTPTLSPNGGEGEYRPSKLFVAVSVQCETPNAKLRRYRRVSRLASGR